MTQTLTTLILRLSVTALNRRFVDPLSALPPPLSPSPASAIASPRQGFATAVEEKQTKETDREKAELAERMCQELMREVEEEEAKEKARKGNGKKGSAKETTTKKKKKVGKK